MYNVISSVSDLGSSSPTSVGNQQKNSSFSPAVGDQLGNMKPSTLRGVIILSTVIFAVALLCSITCISYRRVVAKRKGDANIRCVKLNKFASIKILIDWI